MGIFKNNHSILTKYLRFDIFYHHRNIFVKVFKKRFVKSSISSKIKISKSRERERFHEFLVTNEEIPYCYDIGDMYKITRTENKNRKINVKEFSSESATRINEKRLHKIINELIDDYITY